MPVHRTTAFRWRHRFLTRSCASKASGLTGVAEADETYMLRSYTGQPRRLLAEQTRTARHRVGKAAKPALSDEQVPILVVRDPSGQRVDFVLARANARFLGAALAAAARALGIEHHPVNTARGERRRGP